MIGAIEIQISAPQRLLEGVSAICPIDSFTSAYSLGKLEAKFTPSQVATKQQIADAQAFIAAFDWQDEAATAVFLDAREPALKTVKDNSAQMLAEIDTFLAAASKAEVAELRAEAIASAQRQKTLIQAVERLAGKT